MTKHILAVDDELHIRRLVEINLRRVGYRVTTARDGQEALEQIQAERPDLVLLDVLMPRMDGFALLRRLKADALTARIPVMMLTARGEDAAIIEGWESGVCCYMPKPFHPAELLLLVGRLLEEIEP
jgi:two-component system, OmpR family, alkaline phosphatase synthesis response regulator PhoP